MEPTFGDRVRNARLARGLSQTELARGIVSPSYVSLIETGRRVPEPTIVQALAQRLETTAQYLQTGIDAESAHEELLALRYAELALANGETQEALQRFQQLAGGRLHRSAAQWGVARALETAGDLYGALDRVERLLAEYRAGRADTPGLLLLLNAQCRLANELAERALALFSETDDERGLASMRLCLAWLLLCQSPPDLPRIGVLLDRAYAQLSTLDISGGLIHCECELARYHLACGEPDEALRYANRCIARLDGREVLELADVQVVRGYILAALGDAEASRLACADAVRTLGRLNPCRQHMKTWREAAELLVRLGAPAEALDAYRALADCGNAPQ